jgi:hypothetical protein
MHGECKNLFVSRGLLASLADDFLHPYTISVQDYMVLNRRRPGYTRNDRAGRNAHRFLCRFYTSVARRERAEWQMRSGSGNYNKNPNHHQLALSSEYPTQRN